MKRSHDRKSWQENMKIIWWEVMKKSHEEKSWKEVMTRKHEDCLMKSHKEKSWWETWRLFDRKSWRKVMIESHDEKTWRLFNFNKKSWRENMVESHEEKSCRLFNQAIYIYLISCRVKLSFQIELLSQASQLNSSAWVQLLNSIQHFFKKKFNSTQTQILDLMQSV